MNADEAPKPTGDVLIIDDTPDNLRFLSDLLNKAGYTVRKVISGELGLEAARLEPPDLILLDIKMPGLNGYKVCDQLKADDRTSQIPVIFLSAMHEELDKVMAFEAGGVDYITKPFQVVEVLARIETHLQVSRLQQTLRTQNEQLQQAMAQRTSAEVALDILNRGLEARIQERTADLEAKQNQLLNLQAELQQALAQEQRLNELKSQAIAISAEKLRTVQTLLASAALSLEQTDRSELQGYTQAISESTALLNQVLQEVLLFTGTEIAANQFSPQALDLTRFCQTFVDQWQSPETPSYQLSFVSWGKSTDKVWIDPTLLQQILFHLTSNAVRYSPSGGTILLQLLYQPMQVLIQMRDEGIGIPASELEQIFDRGYRASNVGDLPGSGLGLSVVKQAIEKHGGTVTVESELGQGSSFTLTLPIASSS